MRLTHSNGVSVDVDGDKGQRLLTTTGVWSAGSPDREPEGSDQFDPSGYTVGEVTDYLETADDAERTRVLAAEADGKGRSTIAGWQPSED